MQAKDSKSRRPELASAPIGIPAAAFVERPARRAAREPDGGNAMQLRRILVLADRFNALCALKSDPRRLVDLLGSLVASARGSFSAAASRRNSAQHGAALTTDQARCLNDLENLMRALALGAPEASRGLGHAMDALLIQCVLLEETEARSTVAGRPAQA